MGGKSPLRKPCHGSQVNGTCPCRRFGLFHLVNRGCFRLFACDGMLTAKQDQRIVLNVGIRGFRKCRRE